MPTGPQTLPGIDIEKGGAKPQVSGPVASLASLYLEIHRRAPKAKIVIIGYPQLWGNQLDFNALAPGHSECIVARPFPVFLSVAKSDTKWMNDVAHDLNDRILSEIKSAKHQASNLNIQYVPTADLFVHDRTDQRLCGSTSPTLFNPLLLSLQKPLQTSFHPTGSGQKAIAQRLIQSL
jgi:hypothetical protein